MNNRDLLHCRGESIPDILKNIEKCLSSTNAYLSSANACLSNNNDTNECIREILSDMEQTLKEQRKQQNVLLERIAVSLEQIARGKKREREDDDNENK